MAYILERIDVLNQCRKNIPIKFGSCRDNTYVSVVSRERKSEFREAPKNYRVIFLSPSSYNDTPSVSLYKMF
jgi:hypothetical protein